MFKNVLKRIQNESRSVQLVARNHECLKALNNVLCAYLVVHQDARYERNHELHIGVNYSCNKLHATRG